MRGCVDTWVDGCFCKQISPPVETKRPAGTRPLVLPTQSKVAAHCTYIPITPAAVALGGNKGACGRCPRPVRAPCHDARDRLSGLRREEDLLRCRRVG